MKYAKILAFAAADAIFVNISYIISYLIRFEFDLGNSSFQIFFDVYLDNFWILTLIKLIVFFVFGLYQSMWKYAGSEELVKIIIICLIGTMSAIAFLELTQQSMPRSIYIISFLLDVVSVGGIRFATRLFTNRNFSGSQLGKSMFNYGNKLNILSKETEAKKVMLIGAGNAGASIIKEIKSHPEQGKKVVVAIDDDPAKKGKLILGVKVVGTHEDIKSIARRYGIDEIIIAIPSAGKKEIQAIVNECNKTKAKLKILPALIDLINEKVSISALRDVNIEDLLGRDPVNINLREISSYLEGRIIMVSGGGGSIGSELCRQIARFKPRRLIAVDVYENSVFELANELATIYPRLEFEVVIASVRDQRRMKEIFDRYKPHVVFHAAAHKHVPLMETNPKEAIVNNVLGTKTMVDLSDEFAVDRFVMISTDKAVNPTNVMGASKRMAEMIVQEKDRNSKTNYAVVRFGNVLGSNGSVIPIFRKQIEQGGPVTVTDKNITRYFMTIPEAVQLVIQAGALATGGEIFILDMGEPVKIMDLAENLIKLSGYTPYVDIDIVITQLRPGEKVHEELTYEDEGISKTEHQKIFVGKALDPSVELRRTLDIGSDSLEDIIKNRVSRMSDDEVKAWLHLYIPTYKEEKPRPEIRGVKLAEHE